jgi:hypothetical protein
VPFGSVKYLLRCAVGRVQSCRCPAFEVSFVFRSPRMKCSVLVSNGSLHTRIKCVDIPNDDSLLGAWLLWKCHKRFRCKFRDEKGGRPLKHTITCLVGHGIRWYRDVENASEKKLGLSERSLSRMSLEGERRHPVTTRRSGTIMRSRSRDRDNAANALRTEESN